MYVFANNNKKLLLPITIIMMEEDNTVKSLFTKAQSLKTTVEERRKLMEKELVKMKKTPPSSFEMEMQKKISKTIPVVLAGHPRLQTKEGRPVLHQHQITAIKKELEKKTATAAATATASYHQEQNLLAEVHLEGVEGIQKILGILKTVSKNLSGILSYLRPYRQNVALRLKSDHFYLVIGPIHRYLDTVHTVLQKSRNGSYVDPPVAFLQTSPLSTTAMGKNVLATAGHVGKKMLEGMGLKRKTITTQEEDEKRKKKRPRTVMDR